LRIVKILVISLLTLTLKTKGVAQVAISGYVISLEQNPIAGATVSFTSIHNNVVIGFTQTDNKGYFELLLTTKLDTVRISISHINYELKSALIKNAKRQYYYILGKRTSILPDVVVEPPLIYRRNDTINYIVGAFTAKEDRVIGDIIKKLPGIEMDGDKILYQGRPIQTYNINGLDLLEGRYGIANNNLPVDAVLKVQVVENNQPIKILDSLVFSNRASLNIQLKKFTTTGTGKVGIGSSPLFRDIALTPMIFNKHFQGISSLQTNNVGDDVAKQLTSFTTDNIFDLSTQSENKIKNTVSFLNLQAVSTPEFDEKRWRNNNIAMLNGNILQKLKSGTELKANFSFVNDFQRVEGENYTSLITPEQSINVTEKVKNAYNTNNLRGQLIFFKNEKKIYLKNNLIIIKKWNSDLGNLYRNAGNINILQYKKLEDINLSNKLTAAMFIGKKVATFSSFFSYTNTPQNILIKPGQFENILNDSLPYEKMLQSIHYKDFVADNFISIVKSFKGITIIPRSGLYYQSQSLGSNLITFRNIANDNRNRFKNDLVMQTVNPYVDIKTQYKDAKLRVDLSTPVTYRNFFVEDNITNRSNGLSKAAIEPKIFVGYFLSGDWEMSLQAAYNKQYGNITTLYPHFILTGYSNLQKFNSSILESPTASGTIYVKYKNTLKATFSSLSYSYVKQMKDYIFRYLIDNAGFATIDISNQKNGQISHTVYASTGKFISSLKTIVKLNATAGFNEGDYLLNNRINRLQTCTYNTNLNINNTYFNFFNFSYEARFGYVRSKLGNNSINNIITNSHLLELNFFPAANHMISLKPEYYATNLKIQPNQTFIDILYRFSPNKKKMDVEFSALNLINTKTYVRFFNTEFLIIRNYFEMRPRQFLLSIKFKL